MKYIRRKGKWKNGEHKYVIEENNRYIETVPRADALLKLIRQDGAGAKPSQKEPSKGTLDNQKFVESLLTESLEKPKTKTATPEEIESLWRMTVGE